MLKTGVLGDELAFDLRRLLIFLFAFIKLFWETVDLVFQINL